MSLRSTGQVKDSTPACHTLPWSAARRTSARWIAISFARGQAGPARCNARCHGPRRAPPWRKAAARRQPAARGLQMARPNPRTARVPCVAAPPPSPPVAHAQSRTAVRHRGLYARQFGARNGTGPAADQTGHGTRHRPIRQIAAAARAPRATVTPIAAGVRETVSLPSRPSSYRRTPRVTRGSSHLWCRSAHQLRAQQCRAKQASKVRCAVLRSVPVVLHRADSRTVPFKGTVRYSTLPREPRAVTALLRF